MSCVWMLRRSKTIGKVGRPPTPFKPSRFQARRNLCVGPQHRHHGTSRVSHEGIVQPFRPAGQHTSARRACMDGLSPRGACRNPEVHPGRWHCRRDALGSRQLRLRARGGARCQARTSHCDRALNRSSNARRWYCRVHCRHASCAWGSRSRSAFVILAPPNTLDHSEKLRLAIP